MYEISTNCKVNVFIIKTLKLLISTITRCVSTNIYKDIHHKK